MACAVAIQSQLAPRNALYVWRLADRYKLPALEKVAVEAALRGFEELPPLSATGAQVLALVQADSLVAKSEKAVFQWVVAVVGGLGAAPCRGGLTLADVRAAQTRTRWARCPATDFVDLLVATRAGRQWITRAVFWSCWYENGVVRNTSVLWRLNLTRTALFYNYNWPRAWELASGPLGRSTIWGQACPAPGLVTMVNTSWCDTTFCDAAPRRAHPSVREARGNALVSFIA